MATKVDPMTGAGIGVLIAAVTVVKLPFWAVFIGVPLGVASLFFHAARRSLANSFYAHIARPFLHDVPAAFGGSVLHTWERWDGWDRLHDELWLHDDPARPAGPGHKNTDQEGPPAWTGVPDLYAALGVPRTATLAQVRHAHRRLVKTCHPDVSRSPDAQARFLLIDKAYKVLRDPELRRKYDALASR